MSNATNLLQKTISLFLIYKLHSANHYTATQQFLHGALGA